VLRLENAGPSERDSWTFAPTGHFLGRDDGCDVVLPPRDGISRRHACLRWSGTAFEVSDVGSKFGTSVDGRALEPGAWKTLIDGTRLSLGGQEFVFTVPTPGADDSVGLLPLLRKMTSLDPVVVVSRALDLLREVSRVERALLVDAGSDPRLSPLPASLADPALKVSRSTIAEGTTTKFQPGVQHRS
jgi:pSer/pThr/pTyr-binding forkhead associated (FHA) protein